MWSISNITSNTVYRIKLSSNTQAGSTRRDPGHCGAISITMEKSLKLRTSRQVFEDRTTKKVKIANEIIIHKYKKTQFHFITVRGSIEFPS